ncbi:hypothetical protein [Methylobacterium dankookense]|uniref:Uncharacterized protein n=1 Tax=Methylobacterium dankookense TaxID=560405 RepID=A0A564G4Z1_9HYPH|nr:hypothetical protein [Methylobacterium dankookense]GJD58019.1 hypothetical protein IFDJLNFL_3933 [Methylobacterium dankookense]VUF14631.1 hypothetical protein MTDSW087_04356 [Methylobacterium dankookense]
MEPMTNREMAKGALTGDRGQHPNAQVLPPMPAAEDSRTPTTQIEPEDSPQPNASAKRRPPEEGEIGLVTRR